MQQPSNKSEIKLFEAIICFIGIVFIIGFGLFKYKISLHILLIICVIWAGLFMYKGCKSFTSIRNAMNSGVQKALGSFYIFILIGIIISAFMQSGTIATLIYYGINILGASYFLPAGFILCSIMSVATGTSWGTAGTIGVVLMGIGSALGLPPAIVAGMVISGACFGDKMSPVSDTTNLAALTADTDLYKHIKSMLYSTIPTFIICIIIFWIISLNYSDNSIPQQEIATLKQSILNTYNINPVVLLPIIIMFALMILKVPAEPSMIIAIAVAVFISVVIQNANFTDALNNLHSGYKPNTGLKSLDDLLSRGGLKSMMWTFSMAFIALALGGILDKSGVIKKLIQGILKSVKSNVGLMTTTILSSILTNMMMGEAYLSIVLGGQLFKGKFKQQGLKKQMLSRTLEEGATLSSPLIPWTTAGAFFAGTLSLNSYEYIYFSFFNYLNPIISILLASIGFGVLKVKCLGK